MKKLPLLFLLLAGALPRPAAAASHQFAIGAAAFLLDGRPFAIHCGEIHFARVPREYWRHRLQMCRAMGLNTVCVYLFWNFHEWDEGRFDWSGQADVAEFCRIAQQEGLRVLLRPGPYSCAEWEMGGLPWWLLRRDGIALRTADPKFLDPARRWLREVGRVLGPLQVTRGGPILMVQVENEYGSFGSDPAYMGALRQALLDAGFEVPLFACNPPQDIPHGLRSDLFQVVNFGSDPAQAFAALRRYQPQGPLMNGEYYSGWFDLWGRPHRTATSDHGVADLTYMLQRGQSFSIYMAHGGTTFGLWSGADHPFLPDTSSYDYNAPISEAGWPTEKFWAIRKLLQGYQPPGQSLPPPPPGNPVIEIPAFSLAEAAPVLRNQPAGVYDDQPRTMEAYGQGRGCTAYRTVLPAGPAATLRAGAVHDYAWIFIDGREIGTMDRRRGRYALAIPARDRPAELELLVEAAGRVNFGKEIFDRKGLYAPVEIDGGDGPPTELHGWTVAALPLDEAELASLRFQPAAAPPAAPAPAFWRGGFSLERPGDTFLDLRTWGQGVAWVNGHCLGRFWNIGPTQTMYCPGPWLRAGRNEVVILDLEGPSAPRLAGRSRPILDDPHPERDFAQ
ncbi:MAG TPA: beta-galactosidase family protein [Opitutaceae bacterium]|jgi:beta-galactosidase|nr:beta-galactosidase family protein [Opitutaceae bacterium]